MAKLASVWIYSDDGDIGELSTAGHELAESVVAVIIGDREQAEKAVAGGADEVYLIQSEKGRISEDYVPTIKDLISQKKPNVILMAASKRGRLIAGRLAAAFKTSVLTDACKLWVEDGKVLCERMVYGGTAVRVEKSEASLSIVLISKGMFNAFLPDESRQGSITEVEFVPPGNSIRFVERHPKVGESVNLAASKKVVGIGRGLAKKEDLQLIQELAGLLGAEIGCTRPISEGQNWMGRERYIGVSGVMLKPDFYMAIGISGQIQHMVGVNSARMIIAINKDKNAPVFKQADYGIVGDLYTIVPKIIERLKN